MKQNAALRCRCGATRGVASGVSLESRRHAVCYCDDCQQYAMFLGDHGVLDADGGTDAIMLTQKQVTLTEGATNLQCVRLSPKGLFRWYAGCCNTAIGNTMSAAMPVLLLVHSFVDQTSASLNETFGEPALRIQARFARRPLTVPASPKMPLSFMPTVIGRLLGGLISGANKPSPFYVQGQPRAVPRVLERSEREALRQRVAEQRVAEQHVAAGS